MAEGDGSVGNAASSDTAQGTPASIPQPPGRPPCALDTAAVGRVREVNSTRLTGPEMGQAIEAGDAVTVALLLHAGEPDVELQRLLQVDAGRGGVAGLSLQVAQGPEPARLGQGVAHVSGRQQAA